MVVVRVGLTEQRALDALLSIVNALNQQRIDEDCRPGLLTNRIESNNRPVRFDLIRGVKIRFDSIIYSCYSIRFVIQLNFYHVTIEYPSNFQYQPLLIYIREPSWIFESCIQLI